LEFGIELEELLRSEAVLVLIGVGDSFLVDEEVDGLDGERISRNVLSQFVEHGSGELDFDGSEGSQLEYDEEYDSKCGFGRFSHSFEGIARFYDITYR
jgi:hypothetical protein